MLLLFFLLFADSVFHADTGHVFQNILQRNLSQLIRSAVVDIPAENQGEVLSRRRTISPQVSRHPLF
jgi:hypothetical protein